MSALQFSEDICVERRKIYGIKDQNINFLNCGGEFFMVAEIFYADRADYELDETELRNEVKSTLEKFNLL